MAKRLATALHLSERKMQCHRLKTTCQWQGHVALVRQCSVCMIRGICRPLHAFSSLPPGKRETSTWVMTNGIHACMFDLCMVHDDVIKWKHFPRYWPFVRGPVNSAQKCQCRGALMFSLICVWINGWVNNPEAGDLRRYRAHYDVTVMRFGLLFYAASVCCMAW